MELHALTNMIKPIKTKNIMCDENITPVPFTSEFLCPYVCAINDQLNKY